ncbi:MAG TPA: STAS/SEC14 domain-containing protein [Candidatus Saccharimonadales bacterium]|nr:STAS/SEC14 domain-containing protein [Candidatus Saccharimonadales bacterium]
MQNKVYLNDKGIIVIEVMSDQDESSVEQMGYKINTLITEQRRLGKPSLLLDNVLSIGAVGPEARKLVVQLAKTLDYDRAALVGKGGLMRFGTTLMLRATGRSNKVRYFEDINQAQNWLLQATSD